MPPRIPLVVTLVTLACTALPAWALDVKLTGYDRTRFYLFDSLSLTDESVTVQEEGASSGTELPPEGVRAYFDQRLRLNPHLEVNPHVHVFGQLDLLDLQLFGTDGEVYAGFWDDLDEGGFADSAQLSDSVQMGDDYRGNAVVRRAWGEVWTPYVDFRFGRMGSHWGMGIMANDGNGDNAEFGDTVDRLQVLARIGPVQLSLAFDTHLEGWINEKDDVFGLTLAGGFLSEVHSAGLYVHWRRMPSTNWNAMFADLWGRTRLGPLRFELEAAFQYGKGDLALGDIVLEDQEVLAGGGALRAGIEVLPIGGEVEVGLATGDKDTTDDTWRTFTFDRDHDIALLMFEETMPTFRPSSAIADTPVYGEDISQAVTGNALANAFYIKPGVYFDPLDNLRLRLDFVAARTLVDPLQDELAAEDMHLAMELDFGARWLLYENFELGARVGVMFPGPRFEPTTDPVFGTEFRAMIRF